MGNHQREVYVGIDVHRDEHKAAILPLMLLEGFGTDWRNTKPLTVKNNIHDFKCLDDAIRLYATRPEDAAIAVDHTGGHYSEPLIYFLQRRGYSLYYLEAKAVKAARERLLDEENKSDHIDAVGSAYLLYLKDKHGLSFRIPAVAPELGTRAVTLRALMHHRLQYNKLAIQATNRLHQFLLAVFPEGEAQHFSRLLKVVPYYPTPQEMLASNGLEGVKGIGTKNKEEILRLAAETVGAPGDLYRDLIRNLSLQRLEALAKLDAVTVVIHNEVMAHPDGPILLSFPYLGETAAATIIGVIKDIDRWPNKKKLKKALGVYARQSQSGNTPVKHKQGKEGSREARRALFLVVFGCISPKAPPNDFQDYYLRQVARGKPKLKAIVATMGKLAELIYHCVKAREPYESQGKYSNYRL